MHVTIVVRMLLHGTKLFSTIYTNLWHTCTMSCIWRRNYPSACLLRHSTVLLKKAGQRWRCLFEDYSRPPVNMASRCAHKCTRTCSKCKDLRKMNTFTEVHVWAYQWSVLAVFPASPGTLVVSWRTSSWQLRAAAASLKRRTLQRHSWQPLPACREN